jgi:hypothetical protein
LELQIAVHSAVNADLTTQVLIRSLNRAKTNKGRQ